MNIATRETQRRLSIADSLMGEFESYVDIGLIVGSVAYGANTCVRPDSDLDMLFFSNNVKQLLPVLLKDYEKEQEALTYRFFDGFCV